MQYSVAFRHGGTGILTRACTTFDDIQPAIKVLRHHEAQAAKAPIRDFVPVLVAVDRLTHELTEIDPETGRDWLCTIDAPAKRDPAARR